MKPIGIVRKIDELGRVVIPKEWRTALDIQEGDQADVICIDTIQLDFKTDHGCDCQYKRQVDELGRIVIPKEHRVLLDLKPGDELEMIAYTHGVIELSVYKK